MVLNPVLLRRLRMVLAGKIKNEFSDSWRCALGWAGERVAAGRPSAETGVASEAIGVALAAIVEVPVETADHREMADETGDFLV